MAKQVVWKKTFTGLHNQFRLPVGSKIVHVGTINDMPSMWFIFDVSNKLNTVVRSFSLLATGEEFDPDGWEYVGTVIFESAEVYHIFEVPDV